MAMEVVLMVFISVLLLPFLFLAIIFSIADGDFTLMSKRSVKLDQIEDKVVWITGASHGIGEILATQLAKLGAKFIFSVRNESELERVKKQLTGKHAPAGVMVLPLDLASGEDCLRDAVEKAESYFLNAGVDYMIHNAAFERPMSSAAGKTPAPGQAIYSASKHALNGYFHSLRSELYQKGIRVTVVSPGPIETSNGSGAASSGTRASSEKRVSSERCAEMTIIAASHSLKEVRISYQPVLAVMYLVQYMPTIGYWLMDKIGGNRVEVAARKGNTYSLSLLFGKKKAS